jgi:streptogramin lyase
MTPTPPPITEYALSAGSNPWGITVGPDGALWFTESGGNENKVGRITLAGTITEFPIPAGPFAGAEGITAGPDGNLWFVESARNTVTKLTTLGVFTEYPIPTASSSPNSIALGPDGNLWFTEQSGNNIGRITPRGAITEFAVPTAMAQPWGITAGPDGAMWFTEAGSHSVGRITTAGVITNEYAIASIFRGPEAIAAGPDGKLWFGAWATVRCGGVGITQCVTRDSVGSITTTGAITGHIFSSCVSIGPRQCGVPVVSGIAAGPDGNLWFTEGTYIGRITPTGTFSQFGDPGTVLFLITAGPKGDPHMWFTDFGNSRIGEIHT